MGGCGKQLVGVSPGQPRPSGRHLAPGSAGRGLRPVVLGLCPRTALGWCGATAPQEGPTGWEPVRPVHPPPASVSLEDFVINSLENKNKYMYINGGFLVFYLSSFIRKVEIR